RFLQDLHEPEAIPLLEERLGVASEDAAAPAAVNAAAPADGGGGAGAGQRGDDAFLFVGTQTAIVSDFNVQIAQAAAIADPIVTPVASGTLLRVRVLGVRIAPVERDAVWAALIASARRRD